MMHSFQNNELSRTFEVLRPEQSFANILFDEVEVNLIKISRFSAGHIIGHAIIHPMNKPPPLFVLKLFVIKVGHIWYLVLIT